MEMIFAAEFESRMKEISEIKDNVEERHKQADELMCEALDSFGYVAGVRLFKQMDKCYSPKDAHVKNWD